MWRTAYDIAQVFLGLTEVRGVCSNPMVLAMLRLDATWAEDDGVPWCSAFINFVAKLLRLPRSKSLRARSWLAVGKPVPLEEASLGFDVVIFRQPEGPGPETMDAPGHVGFFSAVEGDLVWVLGGNQSNQVSVAAYRRENVIGVRRLV